jgi:uncharacterized membrane protein (UPF0127 family)
VRLAALLLSAVAAAASASPPDRAPALFPALRQATITATTATGAHEFSVWIAADARSRERGLMYVRELPPGSGMLFLFEFPQPLAFWMKNTYLSLDLVFIGGDGRVLNVVENAKPLSLDPIESDGDAIAVLEVVAGTARRLDLKAGNRVELPGLRTTGKPLAARTSVDSRAA